MNFLITYYVLTLAVVAAYKLKVQNLFNNFCAKRSLSYARIALKLAVNSQFKACVHIIDILKPD